MRGYPKQAAANPTTTGGGFDPATPPAMPTKPADPELAAVVAAWPDLPPALREGIVAMVAATGAVRPS